MRRLLVSLIALLLLLIALDRIGVVVASRLVATRLRVSAGLATDPTVDIAGFPFLTQAISGRYERVDVRTGPFTREGVRLAELKVTLHGAVVLLRDVVSGSVDRVPVDDLSATAVVTYADVASVGSIAGIAVTPSGSGVHVTARLTLLGQSVSAAAESTVRLDGRAVVITAQKIRVLGQTNPLLNAALRGRLDLRVPIGALPYGLILTGVHVSPAGLVLDARSGRTVIAAPPP